MGLRMQRRSRKGIRQGQPVGENLRCAQPRVRQASLGRRAGAVRVMNCMVTGSTKLLLMNVAGNKITKPMLITAFGECM
jgi:hypothetical protein